MAGFYGLWVVVNTAVPRLLAEREALTADLAEARATIARLNARAQVAEAALHELTTTTGRGKAHRVAREVWQRCEESHGLACPTTGRARDLAARLEDELARLREGVAMLADELTEAMVRRILGPTWAEWAAHRAEKAGA